MLFQRKRSTIEGRSFDSPAVKRSLIRFSPSFHLENNQRILWFNLLTQRERNLQRFKRCAVGINEDETSNEGVVVIVGSFCCLWDSLSNSVTSLFANRWKVTRLYCFSSYIEANQQLIDIIGFWECKRKDAIDLLVVGEKWPKTQPDHHDDDD